MENLKKPATLKDLLAGGHISLGAVDKFARTIFDGKTSAAVEGIDGYVVTACNYDDLPEGVRSFVRKAVLEFGVENVLDAAEEDEPEAFTIDSNGEAECVSEPTEEE
jgi:hypothetical protein